MLISEVDELMVLDDGDNYASSMLIIYPSGMGNAQYYKEEGGVIIDVSPHFTSANKLVFVPQLFSALESSYKAPDGTSTFRLNNLSSEEAVIARGTLAQFRDHTALANGTRTWGTKADGTVLKYSDVFRASTYTINSGSANAVEMPVLEIIGDIAYGSTHDISIYASCPVNGSNINCKGDVEVRSMVSDNYKVAISAVSSAGGNDLVINTSNETITLTASLLKNGTSSGLTGATFKWYERSNPQTILGTKAALTVTESMVPGVAEFVCEAAYMGSTYSESRVINDIQDQFMISKGRHVYSDSSKTMELESTNVIKSSNFVEYTPSVVDKLTGAVFSGRGSWTFQFIQTGNDNVVISIKTAASDSVTGATVKAHGGVQVKINATNTSI